MRSRIVSWIKKDGYKLFVLVALFVSLAIYGALKFSPWHDESYSVMLIEQNVQGIIGATGNDVHPPLYYLVLRAWSLLVGDSLVALRISSTLFMLAAILIIWRTLIKEKVIKARPYFVLSAMLLGSFSLRFAFELRMYALGALLVAITFWLMMKIIRLQRPSVPLGIITGLVLTASIYTHYFLSLFAVAIAVFTLWASGNKKPWKRAFLKSPESAPLKTVFMSFVTVLLLFAAWVPTAYEQFSEVREGGFWIGPIKVDTISSMLINSVAFVHQWMLHGWQAIGGLIVLGAIFIFLYKSYRTVIGSAAGKFMISAIVVPLILLILISLPPLTPAFQDRYLSFYSAFLYAGIAIIISTTIFSKKARLVVRLAAVALCIGMIVGVYNVARHGNNQGYNPNPYFTAKDVGRYIQTANRNGAEDINQVVVTNDLWYFFDLHVVLKDTGIPVYMYVPENQDVYEYGNWSALKGRDDLLVRNLESLPAKSEISFVFSSGDTQPRDNPLGSLPVIDQTVSGYAKVNTYRLP